MIQDIKATLFALIKSAVLNIPLSEDEKKQYDAKMLPDLLMLAKKHDLIHLISYALVNNSIVDNSSEDIYCKSITKAMYRYERIKYELNKICATLGKNEVVNIPLKGSVIRRYYKEPWMRTSCDIDILVNVEDCDRAADILVKELGYTRGGKSSHDISLYTASKLHVEIHYDLVEDGRVAQATRILERVWENSYASENGKYCMAMSDEMFYFYHIAHMAKHFQTGGCGIRPLIDLWILDKIPDADVEKRNALLREGELLAFADAVRKLSLMWFENGESDYMLEKMEKFILDGGVYGTVANNVKVDQQMKGGRLKYLMSKIFLPYNVIKYYYPILQKHKWLLPVMQVRRWFKLVFCGHMKRTMHEINVNNSVSKEDAKGMHQLLDNLGLL